MVNDGSVSSSLCLFKSKPHLRSVMLASLVFASNGKALGESFEDLHLDSQLHELALAIIECRFGRGDDRDSLADWIAEHKSSDYVNFYLSHLAYVWETSSRSLK